MDMSFNQQMRRLEQRLSAPLPGVEAQLAMAPVPRQRRAETDVYGRDCREAGVLALIYPKAETPHLILTVRRDDLKDHPGQVSFPGGQRESGEALLDTALREAEEEINFDGTGFTWLGALTPLFISVSNFCVYPFVGMVPELPMLKPVDDEVASILHVPLPQLFNPATKKEEPWKLHGHTIDVPFYGLEQHKVWGATAMMLSELEAIYHSLHEMA